MSPAPDPAERTAYALTHPITDPDPTTIDLDLFAGPGGWDTGLAMLGVPPPLGVEHDADAVATARAAGHLRLDHDRADVAGLDPVAVVDGRQVRLLVASPPCQAWSRAGRRGGIADQPRIWGHLATVRAAGRWVDYDREGWHDDRSPLVLELVRWVGTLRPELVAAEQVPDVLPFWAEVCRWLRGIGYSATCGLLSAEQYGVPQTRQRAFLVARRDGRPARLPAPTHARYVAPRGGGAQADGLFDTPDRERIVLPADRHLLPWVSMAEALGWSGNAADRPARTMCGDRSPRWMYEQGEGSYGTGWVVRTEQKRGSDREWIERDGDAPAPTLTTSMDGWTLRAGQRGKATERPVDEPAPTVLCSRTTNLSWVADRPATTVQGDPRLAGPGHRDREGGQRQFDGEAVRITVEQAGVLQSFPADYPWQGTRTARFRQVGDAVPPLLAAAVLGELLDVRAQVAPRRSQ